MIMEYANSTRFGMFAVAHILWSLLCSAFAVRLIGGTKLWPACVAAVVMMLVYFFLGWVVAHFCRWSVPNGSQSLWAVFLPAGIAWGWAGSVAFCLYGSTGLIGIAAVLGTPAFLLASPSLLFVQVFMQAVGKLFGRGDVLTWLGVSIFFAGLLPPLLFHLGSLCGGKK